MIVVQAPETEAQLDHAPFRSGQSVEGIVDQGRSARTTLVALTESDPLTRGWVVN